MSLICVSVVAHCLHKLNCVLLSCYLYVNLSFTLFFCYSDLMQSLDMTSVSLSDTFAIKGTQETITITISRQEEQDNSVLKTQTPSRRNSNTSNSSSRSSTFNIHYIPFLGEDDMTSSGYSDPGISDNDLSPGASFHGSQEDLFTKSDTEDDFIEKDISNSQPTSFRSKKSFNNDGSSSPRTSPRTRSKVCIHVCMYIVWFKKPGELCMNFRSICLPVLILMFVFTHVLLL